MLPEGGTSIGEYAFFKCTNLTSIVLPEGDTSIGESAFGYCESLKSIVLPEGVTSIGNGAFRGCQKLKITIPMHLGAGLGNVLGESDTLRIHIEDLSALPAKFRMNAALCFAEDGGLPEDPRFESHGKYLKANAGKKIDVAAKNPALLRLLCREKWIEAKDAEAFLAAAQESGDAESIALMLDYQGTKLTSKEKEKAQAKKQQQEDTVYDRALARMQRKAGDIAGLNFVVTGEVFTFDNRAALGAYIASKGGKLQSSISAKTDYLIMNDPQGNTEKIKKAAQLGIEVITEYRFNELADRFYDIDNGVLTKYRGSGGDVVIPKDVTSIGKGAFDGCTNLTSIVLPEGVTRIGENAFRGCTNLTSIVLPEGVTSIGGSAFERCRC